MPKVKRRAPKEGYDNPEKRKYRHKVWKHLSKKAIPILNKNENAKVLMLPSKEGLEIDVAIKFGIKPEQIIAIDENPALLAHAKWKHKIPKENRFGCKVSRVGEKVKDKGWMLVAANLDFCNNFSDELMDEIQSFVNCGCLIEDFYLGITLMKGRETKALLKLIKKIGVNELFEQPRLTTLFEVIDFGNSKITPIYEDSYYESSPIIYAIAEVDRNNRVLLDKKNIESIENTLGKDFRYYVDSKNNDLGAILFRNGYKHPECYRHLHYGWWAWASQVPIHFEASGVDMEETPNCLLPIKYFDRNEAIKYIESLKKYNALYEGRYLSFLSVGQIDMPFEGSYSYGGNDCIISWNYISKNYRYIPNGHKRAKIERRYRLINKKDFMFFVNTVYNNEPEKAEKIMIDKIKSMDGWNIGYPRDNSLRSNY